VTKIGFLNPENRIWMLDVRRFFSRPGSCRGSQDYSAAFADGWMWHAMNKKT
jgi:hypothetical protein